jgi:hypothetical protein
MLTKDLRDVSFTMRRGTLADALVMAERALAAFLGLESVSSVATPAQQGRTVRNGAVTSE